MSTGLHRLGMSRKEAELCRDPGHGVVRGASPQKLGFMEMWRSLHTRGKHVVTPSDFMYSLRLSVAQEWGALDSCFIHGSAVVSQSSASGLWPSLQLLLSSSPT
ncbi:unnamed protein product [Rangifer tarandus platyrhynchus]|uniref:Uncharacterized protein n=2 Tax=Rangifer tarandus platyrhynchus TaxID=3082113 RepID=A0ABN8ZU84_RANTA|nr:unnamed protein product [Rangifer tarandus platyrhynchus]